MTPELALNPEIITHDLIAGVCVRVTDTCGLIDEDGIGVLFWLSPVRHHTRAYNQGEQRNSHV